MICGKCGKETPDTIKYCMNCGASEEEMKQPYKGGDITDVLPDIDDIPDIDSVSTDERSDDTDTPSKKKKREKKIRAPKKKGKKGLKAAIISLCAVGVIGGGAFSVYKFMPGILPDFLKQNSYERTMFNDGLVPYRNGEQYGYLNEKGNVAINAQFDEVSDFSEGLAYVGVKNGDDMEYGYIDKKGKYIINLQFDNAGRFADGIARVTSGDYVGFIDKKGNYVINPQYSDDDIYYIGYDMFLIADSSGDYWSLCDKNANKLSDTRFAEPNNSYTISPHYNREWGSTKNKADYSLIPIETVNGKYCYINKKGKTVIEAKYDSASIFYDGMAVVADNRGTKEDPEYKYGYINEKGKEVINTQFDSAYAFSDGLACVGMHDSKSDSKYANLYGYINKKGKYEINSQYNYANSFENGVAIVGKNNEDGETLYGLINKQGNTLIDCKNDTMDNDYDSDLIRFQISGKYGFANSKGDIELTNDYDYVSLFYADGYAITVTDNKLFTVIDNNGNRIWNKEYDGIGCELDSKICKEDGCLKRVCYLSDDGYCFEHYEKYEEKDKDDDSDFSLRSSDSGSSSSNDEIVGNWSSVAELVKLDCYSSGNAFLSYDDDIAMGTWEYDSTFDCYEISFGGSGKTWNAYIHSSYLNLYIPGSTDSITLYKD